MEPRLLALILFVAIALILGAALLVVRDLRRRRAREVGRRLGLAARPIPVSAEAAGEPADGKQPDWFEKVVAESGTDIAADAAFLAAVGLGLAVGGGLFLWNENLLAGLTGMLGTVVVTTGVFVVLRSRRRRLLLEQLPEVMDFLARSVRSGESLDQAIAMAGELPFRPAAGEFRRCARRLEMGLSLDAALRTFTRRNPLAESRILAATLVVQRQAGGNLPTALERLARVFRDRLAYYRQFRAATASSRGSAMLIIVAALVIDGYVLLWRPEYVRNLLEMPAGRVMLATALILQVLGSTWAYLTLKVEY